MGRGDGHRFSSQHRVAHRPFFYTQLWAFLGNQLTAFPWAANVIALISGIFVRPRKASAFHCKSIMSSSVRNYPWQAVPQQRKVGIFFLFSLRIKRRIGLLFYYFFIMTVLLLVVTFDVLFSVSAWLRTNQWGQSRKTEGRNHSRLVPPTPNLAAGMKINCQDSLGIPTCYPGHRRAHSGWGTFWPFLGQQNLGCFSFTYRNPYAFIKY